MVARPLKVIDESYVLYESVRFFMLAQLLFGCNHGFLRPSSKLLRSSIKVASVALAIYISLFVLTDTAELNFIRRTWYCICMVEYVTVVSALLISRSNYATFYRELDEIDLKLGIRKGHYLYMRITIMIFIALVLVSRTVYGFLFRLYYPSECLSSAIRFVISLVPLVALDLLRVSIMLQCYVVYHHLGTLKELMRNKFGKKLKIAPCWMHCSESSKYNINDFQEIYKRIGECIMTAKTIVDTISMFAFILNIPKFMLLIYEALTIYKTNFDIIHVGFVLFEVAYIMFMLFWTCISAELCTSQADDIRLILYSQWLRENDDRSAREIQRFIEFTKIRPFKYIVYRLIHVNLSLPLYLISVCTTYLIVIIQFTHLFD